MKDRFKSLANAYRMTAEVDPKLNLWLALGTLVPLIICLVVAALTGGWVLWSIIGVLFALLGAMFVLGRRVQAAQFTAIEGMPGAAAAVLQNMRGQWFVVPAVAVNKQQEMVHRVVGRAGIILVAEGKPGQRLQGLIAQQRKKLNRVRGEVPIHIVVVGDGSGDTVQLGKLQVHLTKLGSNLGKNDVPKLAKKLAPLDKGNIPIPKGNIPRGGGRAR